MSKSRRALKSNESSEPGLVRSLEMKDYPAFLGLCEHLDETHRILLPHVFVAPKTIPHTEEIFASWLKDSSVGVFGYEFSGNLVGFVYAFLQDLGKIAVYRKRKIALIDMLSVDPSQQNQGVGKALIDYTAQWAKQAHAEEAWVSVWSANRNAADFYRHVGFETITQKMAMKL